MPAFGPVKRKDLVRYLRELGFEGPFSGGKHQFMIKADVTLRIPNPHQSDISKELLSRILRQAGIPRGD
jgi:predicted RNA binding protein YcfA (HicA-like mRNA interferase family)